MAGRVSRLGYKGHQETTRHSPIAEPFGPAPNRRQGDDRCVSSLAAERLPGGSDSGFVDDVEPRAAVPGPVLPSTSEGFGLYAEAMRHGRPFLACAGTVAEEVAGDSGCALLVAPGDPEALAAGLKQLLTDSARCDFMGSAGQKAQAARFTEEAFCERFRRAVSSFRLI
jgi:hypothetical protein